MNGPAIVSWIRGILGVVVGMVAVLLPAVARNICTSWSISWPESQRFPGSRALFSLGGLKNQEFPGAAAINAVISLALALVIFVMPKESGQILPA